MACFIEEEMLEMSGLSDSKCWAELGALVEKSADPMEEEEDEDDGEVPNNEDWLLLLEDDEEEDDEEGLEGLIGELEFEEVPFDSEGFLISSLSFPKWPKNFFVNPTNWSWGIPAPATTILSGVYQWLK